MAASNFKGPGHELINRVLLFVPAAVAFLRNRCRRRLVQATLSEVGFVDISVVVVGVASTATPLFSRRHRDGRCRRQRHRRWPGRRMTQTWKRQRNLIKSLVTRKGELKQAWVLGFRLSFQILTPQRLLSLAQPPTIMVLLRCPGLICQIWYTRLSRNIHYATSALVHNLMTKTKMTQINVNINFKE